MFAPLLVALFVLIGTSVAAKPVHGQTLPTSTAIPTDGVTRPTTAGAVFCSKIPDECTTDRREPDVLTLTPTVWETVTRINREVNREIVQIDDLAHFGIKDVWTYPDDGMGDCEDIQLEKRRRYVQAGLPKRPFRLTVVIDAMGQGHMILLMRTDRGDFVIDNGTTSVDPWRQTGYEFLKREGDVPNQWIVLAPGNPTPSNPTGKPRAREG